MGSSPASGADAAPGPRRLEAGSLPAPAGPRLRARLAQLHARRPFSPRDVRDAAHRAAAAARHVELDAAVFRGALDVGGAELDHVWAVVAGRVVDVSLPVMAPAFVRALRAYVAGDLDAADLEWAAHGYTMEWRVVGDFPGSLTYRGLPLWSQRSG